ncbi:MAG: ComEC/Rec2 family competence protein, partial [Bacilli bacterium]
SASFLRQIQPRDAVISCGRNNRYGHPHASVMERLAQFGVTVYRTDMNGAVQYRFGKSTTHRQTAYVILHKAAEQ